MSVLKQIKPEDKDRLKSDYQDFVVDMAGKYNTSTLEILNVLAKTCSFCFDQDKDCFCKDDIDKIDAYPSSEFNVKKYLAKE